MTSIEHAWYIYVKFKPSNPYRWRQMLFVKIINVITFSFWSISRYAVKYVYKHKK